MAKKQQDYDSVNRDSMTNVIFDVTKDDTQHVDIDNPTLGRRFSAQKKDSTQRKGRKDYSKEEVAQAVETLKTRGKKGCSLQRLNIGFTDRNVQYLRVMAQITGMTLTEFINALVDKSFEKNRDTFQQAMDIRKQFAHQDQDFSLKDTNEEE